MQVAAYGYSSGGSNFGGFWLNHNQCRIEARLVLWSMRAFTPRLLRHALSLPSNHVLTTWLLHYNHVLLKSNPVP